MSVMRSSLKQHVGLLPDDVSRGPKLSKSLSCVASLHSAQPLSSYHIDALASRLSPDTKDICRDNSTTAPVEETYNLNPLPIEETHGLDNRTQVVKVNSLYRYDKAEIPFTKFASPCLGEFDKFMAKQEDFNAYFGRQLKYNSNMLDTWVIIWLMLKVNLNSLLNMLLWLPLK